MDRPRTRSPPHGEPSPALHKLVIERLLDETGSPSAPEFFDKQISIPAESACRNKLGPVLLTCRPWRGDLLIGGLSSRGLVRLTLNGERVANEDRIDLGRRIREVEQGRDGAIYLLTDEQNGRILRLSPSRA